MTAFGKFLENNTESQPLYLIMVNSILLKNLCASNDTVGRRNSLT